MVLGKTVKGDDKIGLSVLLSAAAFWVVVILLDRAGLYSDKWLGFVIWTGGIFGCVAYLYAESLDEKWRYKVAFFATLILHSMVLIVYLRSVDRFPNVFFLFFSPVEGGIIGGIFGLLGAKPYRARRRKISLRGTPPPETSPTTGPGPTPGGPKGG